MKKQKQKYIAVLLAIFGFWSFLYTFKKDKKKFFIFLILWILLMIFAIIYDTYFYLQEPIATIFATLGISFWITQLGILIYQLSRNREFFDNYYN